MSDKPFVIKGYVRYLFSLLFVIFVLNKLYLRPWVLERQNSGFTVMLVHSLPNFIEAIMGTLIVAGLALHLRLRFNKQLGGLNDALLYLMATLVAGCYVLAQEFKLHNLGGNNTYDPYDLLASVVGLVVINLMMNRYGLYVAPETERG